MEESSSKFDALVTKAIVSNKEFSIRNVLNLRTIKTLFYTTEIYPIIEKLIRDRRLSVLENEVLNDTKNSEYLTVMEFEDEKRNSFVVTVYDSDEMWQDPEVIEIFPMNNLAHENK